MAEDRPDPDRLLAQINRDRKAAHRGALKIFFGASAGVGKTYDMLSDARQRAEEGLDVVVGIVETHGRSETAKLLNGLAEIPRRVIQHRGVTLTEFDIDAAISRNPGLVLLDELAHTNAPGSRHPKRWQDVEELIERGIDVYTTLNVQHLESLNDVVARLSGIQVKETVPDKLFDEADDIVLVDLPSDELLKRLREGKVYLAPNVQKRAAENFFKKRNLIALRELALRRTAERVDALMGVESAGTDARDAQVSEKILVCLGHDPLSTRVLRQARRLASRLKAPLVAVYVETKRHFRLNKDQQDAVERNVRLAERLGAEVHILRSENAVEELLAFAYAENITKIMVGRRVRGRFIETLVGTLADQLLHRANRVEVIVIAENAPTTVSRSRVVSLFKRTPAAYLAAALTVAICTLAPLPLRAFTDPDNLIMFYLIGIIGVAARFGTIVSIFATLLSVLAFNFFYIPPYYSFIFHQTQYYLTFSVMLLTGVVIGVMAGKLRIQALFFRRREREIARLYAFTRELASIEGIENIAQCAARHIRDVFEAEVGIWIPDKEKKLVPLLTDQTLPDVKEMGAAEWAYDQRQEAGNGTDTLPSAHGLYLPLLMQDEVLGVIGLTPSNGEKIDSGRMNLLEAFVQILASTLRRAGDSVRAEQNMVTAESERLRSVLLASISHDLRTPLASISGLAGSLLTMPDMPKKSSDTLYAIQSQSAKLTRIVTNLLDITRLELGNLNLNRQPYFIEEVIGAALLHLQDIFDKRKVETEITAANHLVEMDGLLIEQVIVNLVENAVKVTNGAIGRIIITVEDHERGLLIAIADNGRGIPDSVQHRIFDKFFTEENEYSSSSGLGLAICRAIVELHGGEIWVDNNAMGGATFFFTLPRSASQHAGTHAE
ncbi:MAG: sensor histidine kinase KdpD [Rickettsiales bacterium]